MHHHEWNWYERHAPSRMELVERRAKKHVREIKGEGEKLTSFTKYERKYVITILNVEWHFWFVSIRLVFVSIFSHHDIYIAIESTDEGAIESIDSHDTWLIFMI